MENLKTYFKLFKFILRGYNENNTKDELYLLGILRSTNDLKLAEDICIALKRSGSLFAVPTLMALSKQRDSKGILAEEVIDAIKTRVKTGNTNELQHFFTPAYWQPVWHGTPAKFLSYVAFLSNTYSKEPYNLAVMDNLGEKLMDEYQFNFLPYDSFSALRLSMPDQEEHQNVQLLITELNESLLMNEALSNTSILKNAQSQQEENLIFMRCDYLLTRLNLPVDDDQIRSMLKIANVLNQS